MLLKIKLPKRNPVLKSLTIKGRFFNVCFLQKMLSSPKDRSFTSPENLPGEGLKHIFIREKWRFSAVGENGWLSSNLPPKRNNRPEDRSAENQKIWSGRLDSNQRPLRPERSAPTRLSYAPIFMSLFQAEFLPGIQWECNLSAFSKMSSRNLSFSVKSFLPDPPPSSIFVPGTPFCNSFLFRLLDASIRENERHPSVMASAIALSSFPRNLFP